MGPQVEHGGDPVYRCHWITMRSVAGAGTHADDDVMSDAVGSR